MTRSSRKSRSDKKPAAKKKAAANPKHSISSSRKGKSSRKKMPTKSPPQRVPKHPRKAPDPVLMQKEHLEQQEQTEILARPAADELSNLTQTPSESDPAENVDFALPDNVLGATSVFLAGFEKIVQDLLTAAGDKLRNEALRQILRWITGGPRPEIPALTHLVLQGAAGTVVPDDFTATDAGSLMLARRSETAVKFAIAELSCVTGVFHSGQEFDLTPLVRDGDASPGSWNGFDLDTIRFVIAPHEDVQVWRSAAFPGLLWDLPSVLAIRVQHIRCGGIELTWEFDGAGRLFVPPQTLHVDPMQIAAGYDVEVGLAIAAGELRHVGKARINADKFLVESHDPEREFVAVPAGTMAIAYSNGLALQVEQPFAGEAGLFAEDERQWLARAAATVRHRNRAVTAEDYRSIAAELLPEIDVIDVSAVRYAVAGRLKDGVQLTITPRGQLSLCEYLNRSIVAANRLSRSLMRQCSAGVHVLAGPPSISVTRLPASDDPLWVFREYLTTEAPQAGAALRDGVHWLVRPLGGEGE